MTQVGLMLYSVRAECAGTSRARCVRSPRWATRASSCSTCTVNRPQQVREWLDSSGSCRAGGTSRSTALETGLTELGAEARDPRHRPGRRSAGSSRPDSSEDALALAARIAADRGRGASLGLELGFHNHDGELRPLEGGRTLPRRAARAAGLSSSSTSAGRGGPASTPSTLLERAAGACRSCTSRTSARAESARSARSATVPSATSASLRPRLRPASSGCWSSRTRRTGSALDAARRSLDALTSMLVVA